MERRAVSQRTFEWTLVLIAVAAFFVFGKLPAPTLAGVSNSPAPVDEPSSPARLGLPAKIQSYNVLAVLTADNIACMSPGTTRVVLQTTQRNILVVPKPDQVVSIEKELAQYGISRDGLQVQIVGPAVSVQTLLAENREWNEKVKASGCLHTASPDISSN